MTLVDTHSHIYGEEFVADIDAVLQRASDACVSRIFLPNINAQTVAPMLALARRDPERLYPMMGLHPEDVRDDWPSVLHTMEQALQDPAHPFIAIGEVGLDFYWDRTYADAQVQAFERQVEWSLSYGLPLMIHTRAAHAELLAAINAVLHRSATEQSALHGVFHCFGGTVDEARQLLAYDHFMLGIGGIVTFRKSTLPDVLREAVPLTRIVLETDSPYLAPVPHRGQRNESSFIVHVAETLATIYGVTLDEVARVTTANALSVFTRASIIT